MTTPARSSALGGVCAVAAVTTVVALATSSCAAFDSSSATSAGSSAGSTAKTGPTASAARQSGPTSQQAAYDEPEPQPAAGDLSNFSCVQRRSGRWSASGDITNSASKPMIYTLTVVTLEDTDRITAEQVEEFVLQPAESTTFDLPRFARGSAEACMPRLMRTPR